ncbi:hypothetical protein [Amycolatopsis palatopharyngis]|uniref:hypothetical protein n=1 Tax=Amycolatopsis palatopharyngis TaxID=187982 RepID=UPI000E23CB96|nr:hypothetical protein [Amycolatopsis palatopharyngis]
MLDGLAEWWDALELWLVQRWFPVQFVLVMAVLIPLCLALAWLLGRIVDRVATWFGTDRWDENTAPRVDTRADRAE